MDEGSQDVESQAIVNRGEPIPVVAVSGPSGEAPTSSATKSPIKRGTLKESTEKLKEKLHDVKPSRKAEEQTSIQDRLFST